MVLIILLSTTVFHQLPAVSLIPDGDFPLKHPKELVLPVVTLVIATVPYLYRLVRASMMDVLASDYIQMARLKGVPTSLVVRRHALPNALVPTIQASALVMAYLLGGTVVIEYLFRYPGLGSSLSEAISNRDLPVIQAIVLIFATGVVLLNLLADILTVLVTPRLRESAG
jgi:peptide/nickel transport system permease protein